MNSKSFKRKNSKFVLLFMLSLAFSGLGGVLALVMANEGKTQDASIAVITNEAKPEPTKIEVSK